MSPTQTLRKTQKRSQSIPQSRQLLLETTKMTSSRPTSSLGQPRWMWSRQQLGW